MFQAGPRYATAAHPGYRSITAAAWPVQGRHEEAVVFRVGDRRYGSSPQALHNFRNGVGVPYHQAPLRPLCARPGRAIRPSTSAAGTISGLMPSFFVSGSAVCGFVGQALPPANRPRDRATRGWQAEAPAPQSRNHRLLPRRDPRHRGQLGNRVDLGHRRMAYYHAAFLAHDGESRLAQLFERSGGSVAQGDAQVRFAAEHKARFVHAGAGPAATRWMRAATGGSSLAGGATGAIFRGSCAGGETLPTWAPCRQKTRPFRRRHPRFAS